MGRSVPSFPATRELHGVTNALKSLGQMERWFIHYMTIYNNEKLSNGNKMAVIFFLKILMILWKGGNFAIFGHFGICKCLRSFQTIKTLRTITYTIKDIILTLSTVPRGITWDTLARYACIENISMKMAIFCFPISVAIDRVENKKIVYISDSRIETSSYNQICFGDGHGHDHETTEFGSNPKNLGPTFHGTDSLLDQKSDDKIRSNWKDRFNRKWNWILRSGGMNKIDFDF